MNHERWLVSYADFITLLFAFFVVLYASSQMDKRKMAQISASIHGGFQKMGAFTGNGFVASVPNGHAPPMEPGAQLQGPPNAQLVNASQDLPGPGGSGIDVEQLKKELNEVLAEEIKNHQVEMRFGPEGLVVSLHEVGFFRSGEAQLITRALPVMGRIAKILGEHRYRVRIEGHTDNIPIHNQFFNSNWELSTSRATQVLKMLIEQYGLDPELLSIAGYGEYHPVADNSTAEGRQTNRRVDLIIVSEESERGSDTKKTSARLIQDSQAPDRAPELR